MPVVLEIPPIAPINALPLLVVCGFILMDVATGLAKAFSTNTYSSTKMRTGMWHKFAIVSVIILAYAMESATGLMDFSVIGWQPGSTLPIVTVVSAYVVLMEAGSTMENIVEINPELAGKAFWRYFGKLPCEEGASDRADS